jgi:hypothetical protein
MSICRLEPRRSSDRGAALVEFNDRRRVAGIFSAALIARGGGDSGNPDLPVAKMKRDLLVGRLARLALIAGPVGRFGSHVWHE